MQKETIGLATCRCKVILLENLRFHIEEEAKWLETGGIHVFAGVFHVLLDMKWSNMTRKRSFIGLDVRASAPRRATTARQGVGRPSAAFGPIPVRMV